MNLKRAAGAGLAVLHWFIAIAAEAQATAPTPLPTPVSVLPDAAPSLLRVFGALAVVIAIFLGGVWVFRNWQRLAIRRGAAPRLNVLEVKSLGQRQALFVVGYEKQRMLVATSSAGVSLLSHLPEAEPEEKTVTATASVNVPAPRLSFAEAFQHVLSAKR
jgi:flagellar biogenesis protein FliO